MDKQHKIVNVFGHWEVQDLFGKCITSGDTRDEAIEAFNETKYNLEDDEDWSGIDGE